MSFDWKAWSDQAFYCDGLQTKRQSTAEGRIFKNPTSGTFDYQYDLKDQLGNVRVRFDAGTGGTTSLIQENDYYSFGLRVPILNASNSNNRYLYNDKETQIDLLNQYYYGARFYDPVIGRMTSIDPYAENSKRLSTYTYGNDNSIRFIDPDGMDTKDDYKM